MALYVVYARGVALLVWTSRIPQRGFQLATHAADLGMFSVFIFLTEGPPTSPFMTSDDMVLGDVVAQQVAARLEHFYLLQRMQQSAAMPGRDGLDVLRTITHENLSLLLLLAVARLPTLVVETRHDPARLRHRNLPGPHRDLRGPRGPGPRGRGRRGGAVLPSPPRARACPGRRRGPREPDGLRLGRLRPRGGLRRAHA